MKYSIPRKRVLLGLSALAVCVVLALIAPWVAERLTTPPDAYVYQSGENHYLLYPDGKTVQLPAMKRFSGYLFSPDGKYLYFIDQTDLYRAEYRKLTGDADHDQKFIQHLSARCYTLLFISADGHYVFFLDNQTGWANDDLYVWDGRTITHIAQDVRDIQLDGSRIVYRTGTSSQDLFAVPFGQWNQPVKLVGQGTSLQCSDLSRILYLKHTGNYYPSLYQHRYGRTTELAQNVYAYAKHDGCVYYLTFRRSFEHQGIWRTLCDLYRYKDGHTRKIASDVVPDTLPSEPPCNIFTYHRLEELDDAISRPYFLDPDSEKNIQLSSETALQLQSLKSYHHSVHVFEFTEHALLLSASATNGTTLYAASVFGDTTGPFTDITLCTSAYAWYTANDTLYYTNKQADRRETRNLYAYRNGQSVCVLENVLRGALYEDGCWLSHKNPHSADGSYTLQFTDADGHTTIIADHVTKDLRTASGAVLYISDGVLYRYDGTRSTRLAENVSSVRSADWMLPVKTWGNLPQPQ